MLIKQVLIIPGRFVPLAVAAAAVALLPGEPPGALDWTVALVSAVLTIGGGTWPLAVALAQSALLALAVPGTTVGREVVQVLAAWAVLELVMRRGERSPVAAPTVLATLALAAATAFHAWRGSGGDFAVSVFWVVVVAGAATGLGVHMWSLRLWMTRYFAKAHEAERLRESETIAARATERTAIARELHDLVAHHVASIVLRVGVVRHVVADADPRVTSVLDDVHATADSALADLAELVGVLRDPATVRDDPHQPMLDPADLPAALTDVVDRIRRSGLPVRVELDPRVTELDAIRRLAVLRIAQEGLTNALKHADRATGARLRVALDDSGGVRVEVSDDGAAPRETAPPGGFGLIGLGERVELAGGTLTAGPGAEGWLLVAELPPVHSEAHR
ncbi:sensor histidine kinase [Amycolatopsis nigrescens]|uniref:sensor histidine kinase n=1 Tax=Amycolatopsis nigrescens TaxID=381445 RepID=UPI000360C05A|nr:histidine kinase [Amycolatopsis nigrescens]